MKLNKEEYRKVFGMLFRKHRKNYEISSLLLADDDHPFWNSVSGQPVCSPRTIYNIEKSENITDEAVIEFCVKKMGYHLFDEENLEEMERIGNDLWDAIMQCDGNKLIAVKKRIDLLNQNHYFMIDDYCRIMKMLADFYLKNDIKLFKSFEGEKYIEEMFIGIFQDLFCLCKFNNYAFVDRNFRNASLYLYKMTKTNNMDREVFLLEQLVFPDLLRNMENTSLKEIRKLDEVFSNHYIYLVKNIKDYFRNSDITGITPNNIEEKDDIGSIIKKVKALMREVKNNREYKIIYEFLKKTLEESL